MKTKIEKSDEDGSLWIACTKDEPLKGKVTPDGIHIYHPDAKVTYTSHDGSDDHYDCPNCFDDWWVEYDG